MRSIVDTIKDCGRFIGVIREAKESDTTVLGGFVDEGSIKDGKWRDAEEKFSRVSDGGSRTSCAILVTPPDVSEGI